MTTIELMSTGTIMGVIHVLSGPDHLSALATLSGTDISSRSSKPHAFLLGVKWGIGHSLGLLAVAVILIALGERSGETIVIDDTWSIMLEGFVGVFMLALGLYGLRRAFRNRDDGSVSSMSPCVDSLELQEEGAPRNSFKIDVVEMPGVPVKISSDSSIANMMAEVLDQDSIHGSLTSGIRKFDAGKHEEGEEGEGADQFLTTDIDGIRKWSFNRSASFVNYQSNRPSPMRAQSLVKRHAVPETSIVQDTLGGSRWKFSLEECFSPGVLALVAGVFHGVAGPGGVLGVIPAVQLRDPMSAAMYLGMFCLTSTLAMGTFAAFYGTLCQRMAGERQGTGGSEVFWVEVGSAFLSIAVGIVWLALLSTGYLEEVFP
eukprot:CAMPEP_0183729430 /NCGR_PEP_ID=MMETSP0737-20130205/30256_1 /TAXON_ID=385413 /ORGANISM="Thalassiosira miniscula, Strain CCMP1093" /LENGTH=372 /DNA_ID=CAMNT_0025961611 /DNA_START=54 /DNA_END=1172 /DNA_ORIENTATION=-